MLVTLNRPSIRAMQQSCGTTPVEIVILQETFKYTRIAKWQELSLQHEGRRAWSSTLHSPFLRRSRFRGTCHFN